jgi:hypothetical protein
MLSGSYVVINQLIRSIWKVDHVEQFLLYMLKENIYQSKTENDQDWDFWK